MRVLWLNAGLLLPLDKGGKLRTWHLMRHLARRHTISYLSFADPDSPPEIIQGMREVASRIDTIPRRAADSKSGFRFYADVARHLFDPLPYAVGKYRSNEYRARVRDILRKQSFDVIVCDFLPPALHLPAELPCPAVLFTHNVEAEIWRRHAATQPTPLHRWLYGLQHRRMARFEELTLKRFSAVLAVSDTDAETFSRLYPRAMSMPVHVIPTGVDTAFFSESTGDPGSRGSKHLVFTGSMDWLPNVDAMRYFCEQILPRVRVALPEVTLSIVGRAPAPSVKSLASLPGVTVTGAVDDVRPFIREAAVYIVPLRIGGGTRLKIFEAMAMGKAVVSTSVGAEGLPVRDGTHLLLADDPAAFSAAVVDLIRQPARRFALGGAARALIVERYDWSSAAQVLEHALEEAATPTREVNPNFSESGQLCRIPGISH